MSGGILNESCRIALSNRLPATSPGTTAGPLSPPLRIAARVSRRKPPCSFFLAAAAAGMTLVTSSDQDGANLGFKGTSALLPLGRPQPPPARKETTRPGWRGGIEFMACRLRRDIGKEP